ncbi:hypothetical protein LXA43DRAFT_1064033 [Ganoderma leucocontextum]|nr:hypothetical protein LXA43DRAFT_1064033 [Ganoderma leucocontextum]
MASKIATFVAFSAATLLFGVLSSQSLTYFRHYPHDRLFLKIFVGTILVLETAQLLLFAVMAWFIVLGSGPSPYAFHLVSGFKGETDLRYKSTHGPSNWCYLATSWYWLRMTTKPAAVLSVQGLSSWAFDVNSSNPVGNAPAVDPALLLKTHPQVFLLVVDAITGAVDILLAVVFVVVLVPARPGSPGGNSLVDKLVICPKLSHFSGDIDGNCGQVLLNVNAGVVNALWAFVALGLGFTPSYISRGQPVSARPMIRTCGALT